MRIVTVFIFFLSCHSLAFGTESFFQNINKDSRLTTFAALLKSVSLENEIDQYNELTLFAPSNQAFESFPQDLLRYLKDHPSELRKTLLYHFSPSKLKAKNLAKMNEIKTLAGKTIGIYKSPSSIKLNQLVPLSEKGIKVKNGRIYPINHVLSFNEKTPNNDIETETNVDLTKYLGTWYEIARYKNSFQTECRGTKAEYSTWSKYIRVRNTCQLPDGTIQVGKALATVVNKNTNASLAVSFVPLLNLFGLFAGDYNILYLGPDYDYSLVGDKARSTFWILSRTKEIPEALYQELLDIAEEKGFRRDLIFRSPIFK